MERAANVFESTIVREAWQRHADPTVTGWICSLRDGLLIDLGFNVDARTDMAAARAATRAVIRSRYGL